MCDDWKSSWLPRSGKKLPSNLSSNATVGQHELTPPPTLDTSILLLTNADYLPIVTNK